MQRPFPQTIPELLAQRVEATPDVIAFSQRTDVDGWRGVKWSEAYADIMRLAAFLRRRGFRRGDRFVIIATPSLRWETLHLAVLFAGGTVVGVEPHASQEHIEYVLDQCNARWWAVEDHQVLSSVSALQRERMRFSLSLGEHHDGGSTDCVAWNDVLIEARSFAADHQLSMVRPSDAATLIYTSGTTGQPKAILYTHAQLLAACKSICDAFPQIVAGDTTLCWLPLAHLFQRMMNLVAISRGVSIYFVPDPRDVLPCAREVEPAVFFGVPRFYEKLYHGIHDKVEKLSAGRRWIAKLAIRVGHAVRGRNAADGYPQALPLLKWVDAVLDRIVLRKIRGVMGSKMRFMITGAAPTPTHMLEFFHAVGWPLLEAYGISENSIPMAANRPDQFRIGSVGKPLPANELRFEEDGEILVRGSGVFAGYECQGTAADSRRLFTDGYYRTGDVGYLDEDGYLFLTGRKSELMKTSTGRRLSPTRIESAYTRSGVFEQVVVFGNNRNHLVGLVVPNRERIVEILSQLDERLDVACPALFEHPAVKKVLAWEMEVLGDQLSPYERITDFAALAEPLRIDRGELTPTLKLRRTRIEERFADLIGQLYDRCAPRATASD